ncbi:hypothetical protein DER46DRAFT_575344 [Fusarium sp. MPI-SDFR-AT-0072]|nr:hypothetical protein DER46DRAFT_575344 [Fusarium sp. MPI-SDFR-AT-0072]
MPLNNYGVWKGKLKATSANKDDLLSNHFYLHFDFDVDNNNQPQEYRAGIHYRTFSWTEMTSPVTPPVTPGYRPARVDYLRGCIEHIPSGEESYPSDNITYYLEPFFENAIEKGEFYPNSQMVTRRPYSSPSMNKALKRTQTVGRSVEISAAKSNIAKKTHLQEQVQESEESLTSNTHLYEAVYPHSEPECHLTICNITKDEVVDLRVDNILQQIGGSPYHPGCNASASWGSIQLENVTQLVFRSAITKERGKFREDFSTLGGFVGGLFGKRGQGARDDKCMSL